MLKFLSALLFLPITLLLGQERSNNHVVSAEIDSSLIKNGLQVKLFSYGLDTSVALGAGKSRLSFENKADGLGEFVLYTLSDGNVSKRRVYSDADEATVKISVNGSERGFSQVITSKYNGQLEAFYLRYVELCKPINLNFKRKLRDSVYMAGLANDVMPEVRRVTIDAYDSLVREEAPPAILAMLLNMTFDDYHYDFHKYSKVSDYYLAEFGKRVAYLDDLSVNSPELQELKNNIALLNERSPRTLTDFNIKSSDNTRVSLERLAKDHKYLLVNVWMRSCGPCRKFNKEMQQSYDELKRLGIEIVNVNADYFESDWKEASEADGLLGVDSYTNADSKARYFYNPENRYPAKTLFVNGTEVMGANTKSPAKLVEQIKQLEGGSSD